MRGGSISRLNWLRRALLVVVLVLAARLTWVQFVARDRYFNPTGIRYTQRTTLLPAKGELRDRNGRVLARNIDSASIYCNPQVVVDPAAAAARLSPILDEPPEKLEPLLAKRLRRARLRTDVDPATVAALRPLFDAGILSVTDDVATVRRTIVAHPTQISTDPEVRTRLALILGLPPEELANLLAEPLQRVVLLDEVEPTLVEQVERLGVEGISIETQEATPGQTVYLNPVDAALEPGSLSGSPEIRTAVWDALEPLWAGATKPSVSTIARRLKVYSLSLKREVPALLGEAIRARLAAEEIEYASVVRESTREYPQGELGRSLLGAVDPDEQGTGGLELTYNYLLSGQSGWHEVTVDPRGRPILQERLTRVEPRHGYNVELTLDATIQSYAEEAVLGAVTEFDADWGLAVVVDPFSGEVLALADIANPERPVRNASRSLGTPYEPGSILKPLVVAAAMDEGLTSSNDPFYCGGGMVVGNRRLSCIRHHGAETTYGGVRDSCNVVMMQIAQRMGQAKLEPQLRRYGLFERTGIGLASQESLGAIFVNNNEGRWGLLKTATVSYGKGIQVSSIGLVRAYSALLNGGRLPDLHLIRRLVDREGRLVSEAPTDGGPQVMSSDTADAVKEMLRGVIADPKGTGKIAASALYDLGGKTGTSVAYGTGDSRVVSMTGYGPHEQPRLMVLVSVCEPRRGPRWGGVTCGPALRTIIERSLQYLGQPANPGAAEAQAKASEAAAAALAAARPEPASEAEPEADTTTSPTTEEDAE